MRAALKKAIASGVVVSLGNFRYELANKPVITKATRGPMFLAWNKKLVGASGALACARHGFTSRSIHARIDAAVDRRVAPPNRVGPSVLAVTLRSAWDRLRARAWSWGVKGL